MRDSFEILEDFNFSIEHLAKEIPALEQSILDYPEFSSKFEEILRDYKKLHEELICKKGEILTGILVTAPALLEP